MECFKCHEEYDGSFEFCPHCGTESPNKDKKKCTSCAEWIQRDATKCRYCGETTIQDGGPLIEKEQNTKKPWLVLTMGIVLVVLIIGALVVVIIRKDSVTNANISLVLVPISKFPWYSTSLRIKGNADTPHHIGAAVSGKGNIVDYLDWQIKRCDLCLDPVM